MQPSKILKTTALCGSLMLCSGAILANVIATAPGTPPENFVVGAGHDYTLNEQFTGEFYSLETFDVTQAGTYELILNGTTPGNSTATGKDAPSAATLKILEARVATRDAKLATLAGAGSLLFDLQPGTYSIRFFAKTYLPDAHGAAGLMLRLQQDAPAAVPAPAALWLFGSGLLGLAGMLRRRA